MKIFSLLHSIPYEGSELLGVFGSLEEARKFGLHDRYSPESGDYVIVESELGQSIDLRSVRHELD